MKVNKEIKNFKIKTKNIISNFEEESRLEIRNQSFPNKIGLYQYIQCFALSRIICVDCNFENCNFKNIMFRKFKFYNCRFQNR